IPGRLVRLVRLVDCEDGCHDDHADHHDEPDLIAIHLVVSTVRRCTLPLQAITNESFTCARRYGDPVGTTEEMGESSVDVRYSSAGSQAAARHFRLFSSMM